MRDWKEYISKTVPVIWRRLRDRAQKTPHWARAVVAAILVVTGSSGLAYLQHQQQYALSPAARIIVGDTSQTLADKLAFDAEKEVYRFNQKTEEKVAEVSEQPSLTSQVGAADGDTLYSLDIPAVAKKGITYHDANTDLKFDMVPQFESMDGRLQDGRLIFPLEQGAQAVYTVKTNGLKEDIIFERAPEGGKASFAYTLELPETLEARMMDDGAVGIYSASPLLFGDIAANASDDKAKLLSAQKSSPKDHLLFAMPAPKIFERCKEISDETANGCTQEAPEATARFELEGDTLTLHAEKLDTIEGTFSVDPSVVVTSSSDFGNGNDEGGIDFETDAIARGGLTGGSVGSWQNVSSFPTGRVDHATTVYNGYMYISGGFDSGATRLNDVQYAPINADGTVGTWQATTNFAVPRHYHTSVAYNGYLYIIGGRDTSNNLLDDVQYAKINADGSLGTWQSAGTFPTGRYNHTSVVNNGYLYIIGGFDYSTQLGDVRYAAINADGSLGAWQSTTSFGTPTNNHASVVYNNYLYVIGGYDGNNPTNRVEYAPINEDGTVGAWRATTGLSGAYDGHTATVYNGYIYSMGGSDGSNNTDLLQYAPINTDGSVGSWRPSDDLPLTPYGHAAVAYNGYIYTTGGDVGVSTKNDDVYMTAIDPPGVTTGYTSSANLPTGVDYQGSAVYNGYVYNVGGNEGEPTNAVYYAAINNDGTLDSWTATTDLPKVAFGLETVVYNGYIYASGGRDSYTSQIDDLYYAPINENGTIGGWQATTDMPETIFAHELEVRDGYLYSSGGDNGSAYRQSMYYAAINADGTVGSWTATTNLPDFVGGHETVIHGDYMYTVGGNNGSAYLDSIHYAPINSNGSIGSWTATTDLAAGVWSHSTAVHNGYLYVTGGEASGGYSNDVSFFKINADGSLGSLQVAADLPNAIGIGFHETVVVSGKLYTIGGYNPTGGELASVVYATINNGGSGQTGAWQNANSLGTARADHATAVHGNYVYVLGGIDDAGNYLNSVEYAPLNADGSVGTWQTTTSFTNARLGHSAVAYNGYMYVVGGELSDGTETNDVRFAPINADGTLGSWTATTGFTTARTKAYADVYEGRIYIMGGYGSAGETAPFSDAQVAAINADGSLGGWATTTSLPEGRSGAGGIMYDGHVYLLGGTDASSQRSDVLFAPINTDGSFGTWQSTTDLPGVRTDHAVAVYSGYLYVTGGENGAGAIDDSVYAPISAGGGLGDWQAASDLAANRTDHASVAANGHLYELGGSTQTAASPTILFSDGFEDGTLAPFTNDTGDDSDWFVATGTSNTGTRSAESGNIADSNTVSMSLTQTLNDSGQISFARKVSSEDGWDFLRFYVDGNLVDSWSGEQDWQTVSYPLGAGSHDFRWEYFKDSGVDAGSDTAWIDDVKVEETTATEVSVFSDGFEDGTLAPFTTAGDANWSVVSSTSNSGTRSAQSGNISDGTGQCAAGDGQETDITLNYTLDNPGIISFAYRVSSEEGWDFFSFDIDGDQQLRTSGDIPWDTSTAYAVSAGTHTFEWTYCKDEGADGGSDTTWIDDVEITEFQPDTSGEPAQIVPDVSYAPLQSVPRVGRYSKLIDLGTDKAVLTNINYKGNLPGGLGSISYRTAKSDGVFGARFPARSISEGGGSGTCVSSENIDGIQYVMLDLQIDDSKAAVFPDDGGSIGAIEELTVIYSTGVAPPDLRLRGGKFFSGGALQPLDTC